jgi:hypothetical protein
VNVSVPLLGSATCGSSPTARLVWTLVAPFEIKMYSLCRVGVRSESLSMSFFKVRNNFSVNMGEKF